MTSKLPFVAGVIETSAAMDYDVMTSSSFTFTVYVTDSKDTATATLTINVININEAPSFGHTSYSVNGDEGTVMVFPEKKNPIIFLSTLFFLTLQFLSIEHYICII
jgi:hypothetical protein